MAPKTAAPPPPAVPPRRLAADALNGGLLAAEAQQQLGLDVLREPCGGLTASYLPSRLLGSWPLAWIGQKSPNFLRLPRQWSSKSYEVQELRE